jgi:hypothetical protein
VFRKTVLCWILTAGLSAVPVGGGPLAKGGEITITSSHIGGDGPPTGEVVAVVTAGVLLTVPLGVNTYSSLSETPMSRLWHWSGYLIGGSATVTGVVGLAVNLTFDLDNHKIKAVLFSATLGYGALHLLAAYFASEVEPESNAGVFVPTIGADQYGAYRMGLTWMKRF